MVILTIDMAPLDQSMDEKELLSVIDPCLNRLRALKGSFDRRTDIVLSVGQHGQEDGSVKLSARVAIAISVGKYRAQHLLEVFDAYTVLLRFELPAFRVYGRQEIVQFP